MVYEEEDFQSMQYGYHLNPDISEQRVVGMLREVEEELHRKTRSKQCEVEGELIVAVYARIKFVRVLYQALLILLQRKDEPTFDCQRLLSTALELLFLMQKTVYLGVQPEKDGECTYKILLFKNIVLHIYF